MKFHWFAQMTYQDLPDEFTNDARKYPTAWVTVPPRLMDPAKMGQTYHMFQDLMETADEVGFDGLAVNEHHQNVGAISPSPSLFASALARNTQNAAIVVIGNSLALYNPPLRVAEEYAFLDCLSGGRLVAGFVYGTPMDSLYSYGTPPIELRERFAEARDLILKGWATDEPFAFDGKYTQLRYVNPQPKPIQQPPPIWMPGSGSLETWDLVTENNYVYGVTTFAGLNSAKPMVNAYWDFVSERDGEMNPHRMALTQICCVADSMEEAERLYYPAIRYFYLNANRATRGFAGAPGYRSTRSMAFEMERSQTNPDRDKAYRAELTFREYVEKGFIVAGSPDDVADQIRNIAKELRVGQLIPCLHMGNLPYETAKMNTTRFGLEVIPQLRDVWADQPDHWTPKVSQERVAALEASRSGKAVAGTPGAQ